MNKEVIGMSAGELDRVSIIAATSEGGMRQRDAAVHSPDEDAVFDAKFAIEGLALAPEREALLALDRFGDADLAAHRDAIQLLISTRRIEYLEDDEVAAIRRLEALFEIDGPAGLPD